MYLETLFDNRYNLDAFSYFNGQKYTTLMLLATLIVNMHTIDEFSRSDSQRVQFRCI